MRLHLVSWLLILAAPLTPAEPGITELRQQGRYAEALEMAIEQRDRLTETDHEFRLSDHERLIETLSSVALLDRSARDRLARADALTGEIDGLSRQGNLIRAFRLATEQLRIRFEILGPHHPETLEAWDSAARIMREAGDYSTTLEIARHVLDARRRVLGPRHPSVALALNRVAQVKRNLHTREAVPLYREALKIAEPLRQEYPEVYLEILFGWAFLQGHTDPDEAVETFQQVLHLSRSLGARSPVPSSAVITWIGWTLANVGRHDEAWLQLRQAEQMLREEGLTENFNLGVVLGAMGDLHAVSGRWSDASRLYQQAMEIFEVQRSMTPPGFSRRRVHFEASAKLALVQLKQQHWKSAWHSATRARGMLSLEFIAKARWKLVDPKGFARQQSILRQLEAEADVEGRLTAERRLRRLELRSRLFDLEQAYLARHRPDDLELEQLQEELAPRTAYIGWLSVKIGNASSVSRGTILASDWIFVVRRDSINWIPLQETSDSRVHNELVGSRHQYRKFLKHAANWPLRVGPDEKVDEWNREWGRRFFDPALTHLDGIDNLVVEVGLVAPEIALESMRGPDGTYIGDRFVVSYSPSPVTHSLLANRTKPVRRRALILGDPLFSAEQRTEPVAPDMIAPSSDIDVTHLRRAIGGDREALDRLPRLPLSRFEAERIAEMFPVSLLLTGEKASEQQIADMARSKRLADYDVIHLATHMLVDPIPERSALALSRTDLDEHPADDGLLNAMEILQSWSLDADILTLSGCQSAGLFPEAPHFVQALLGVGARSVVASMWNVDDLATALLMTRFYENLVGVRDTAMTKARALQEAKIWIRNYEDHGARHFEHPIYWSGFILIGSPN